MQFHVGPQWYRISVCPWGILAHAKLFCSWLKFLKRIVTNDDFFVMEVLLASWLYPPELLVIRALPPDQMCYMQPQGTPFDCISEGKFAGLLDKPQIAYERRHHPEPWRSGVFYIMLCKDPFNSTGKYLKYAAWWGAVLRQTFIVVIFSLELETRQMVLWWVQWDNAESISYIAFGHVTPLSTFLDQFYDILDLSVLQCWTLFGECWNSMRPGYTGIKDCEVIGI